MDGRTENGQQAIKPEPKSDRAVVQGAQTYTKEGTTKGAIAKTPRNLEVPGLYAYYGISLNYESIAKFYMKVRHTWFKWYNRCSAKVSKNWEQFGDYLQNYPLPKPRIVHSFS